MNLWSTYATLATAIVLETVGTSFLYKSEEFTRLWPTIGTIICYAGAFYLLSITLRVLPVGIAYGIWSAIGIILITLIGTFIFKQAIDLPAIIGIGFIIAGVLIINLFSATVTH